MSEFDGKTVLITGASRGIGKEIAVAFAKAGANIFLTDVIYPMEETMQALSGLPVKVESAKMDVTQSKDAEAAVKKCTDKLGSVDILINNAGITKDGLLMRMKDSDWEAVLNVNLKGAFIMTRAVIRPMMKKRYGKIINIASVIGVMGNAGQANYAASKAGMIGLAKSAARELASRGINVNCIAPGYIVTEMTEKLDEKVKDAIMANIPLQKLGSMRDIAQAALFLASPSSDYITGQVIHVNGGLYM
ncbi:MAG: 3-oxoacyl-[acyl-carrier-protein] reductase [Nitrospinota bacterium]